MQWQKQQQLGGDKYGTLVRHGKIAEGRARERARHHVDETMDERLTTQAASVARGVRGGCAVLGARTTGTGRGPSGEEQGALR